MSYRFRYLDWRGVEVDIHTLEQLQQHIRLKWISSMTLLHDALTGEWAPAQSHSIYRLITDPNVEIRDHIPEVWPEEAPGAGDAPAASQVGHTAVESVPHGAPSPKAGTVKPSPVEPDWARWPEPDATPGLGAGADGFSDLDLDGPALTLELPEDTPSPEDVIKELMEERERDRELPSEDFVTLNTSQHLRRWSEDEEDGPVARQRTGPTTDQRLRPRERWSLPAEQQVMHGGRRTDPRLRAPMGEAPAVAHPGGSIRADSGRGGNRWLLFVSAAAAVIFALAALYTAFGGPALP